MKAITKNSDNTSIMSTTLANADIIHIPAGLIRGLNKTLTTTDTNQLLATFEFEQIIVMMQIINTKGNNH